MSPVCGAFVTAEPLGENGLRLEVRGRMQPLLAALAEHDVLILTSREPSLEEVFLRHYERPAA